MGSYMGVGWTAGFFTYNKLSDMVRPSPSGLWVILDESKNTINDAFFAVPMDTYDPKRPSAAAFVDVIAKRQLAELKRGSRQYLFR